MGLRETATSLGASVGAATLLGLSVFYNSPVFGVLLGIILGALVTDFTQSRALKRTARRELELKNIETIYSPLYKEVGSIQNKAINFSYNPGYQEFDGTQWARISSEYYYHLIEPDVKKELISLYGLVTKFNTLLPIMRQKVGDFILKEGEKTFGFPLTGLLYGISVDGIDASAMAFDNALLFGIHPKKILESTYHNQPNLRFYVYYSARKSSGGGTYSNSLRDPKDLARFDQLYSQLLEDVKKIDTVEEFGDTLKAILNACPGVRTSVLATIQKPLSV